MTLESEGSGRMESAGAMTPGNGNGADPVKRWMRRLGEGKKSGLNRATLKRYMTDLGKFTAFTGKSPIELVAAAKADLEAMRDSIDDFIQSLRDQGMSTNSLRIAQACLRSFFKAQSVVFPGLKSQEAEAEAPARPLTEEEVQKVLSVADPRERCMIYLCAHGGIRGGSLSVLRVGDVDFSTNPISLHAFDQKRDKAYITYLTPEAGAAIQAYLALRKVGTEKIAPEEVTEDSPLIRTVAHGKPLKVGWLDNSQVGRTFRALFAKGQINHNVSSHSCRKYHFNRLVNAGVPESHVNLLQGKVSQPGSAAAYIMPTPEVLGSEYMRAFVAQPIDEVAMGEVEALKKEVLRLARALWEQSEQIATLRMAEGVLEVERRIKEITAAERAAKAAKAPPPK